MSDKVKPKTHPRLVVPQESPSPEPNDGTRIAEAPLSDLASQVLQRRGVPAPIAQELSGELGPLLAKAAGKVPSWVLWVALSFGVPALTAFYATWKSIEALPPRVEKLEQTQEKQGAQLDRIEALLRGPDSRPRY